jgi:tetratricopeptide (TPR) repeat protein
MEKLQTWRELRRAASRHRFEQNLLAAIDSFERAIAAAEQEPAAAEEVGVMHNAIADLYVRAGDSQSAINHLRRAIAWDKSHLPADSLLGDNHIYLASLLQESGAESEATDVAQEGISLHERKLGAGHPEVARMRELLAAGQTRNGRDGTASCQSPPLMCPRCAAVLGLWGSEAQEQTCGICKEKVRR